MAPDQPHDPYRRLLELSERELECAGAGRLDALPQIAAERKALIESLPARPPASARQLLVQATLTQTRVTMELQRGREQALFSLRRVLQARRAARGYYQSAGQAPAAPRVDARV